MKIGRSHARDFVEQCLALVGREFTGVAIGDRFCPTVLAREVAGLRRLPDDEERAVVEVDRAHRPGATGRYRRWMRRRLHVALLKSTRP